MKLEAKDATPRACVVCDARDTRALSSVRLHGGETIILCGTHGLMLERTGRNPTTAAEVKDLVCDRRGRSRRAEEIDELAAGLTAAFSGERRHRTDRRGV